MAVISGMTNYVGEAARNDILLELALQSGDEVGDGVTLRVGFVSLEIRVHQRRDFFVVLNEEVRLEVELLEQQL